jgi:hypothetical protein
MFLDADLTFSNEQAITAAAVSQNILDLGPLFVGPPGISNLGRNIGLGDPMFVAINVDVAMTDAASDSTLTVDLQTDDNAGFASAAIVATLIVIPALQAAGRKFMVRLPVAAAVPYERFIRLNYTPNNGNLTTGTFSAFLVKDADLWSAYGSGISTGI